jgi:hypothetical protein
MQAIDTGYGFWFDPEARPDGWLRGASEFYSMIVHTQGHNPAKLLFLQRPNESDEILNFRLNNFEPITMDAINRAMNEIFYPIGEAPFNVYVDDDTAEYLDRPIFGNTKAYGTGKDYYAYIFNDVAPRVISDPNGYLTWLPAGEGVEDASVQLDPKPYQIYWVCITELTEDRITFYKPEDRFYFDDGTVGRVFITITKDAYYKHREFKLLESKSGETSFTTEPWYVHNLGEIPIVLNGGLSATSIGRYDYKTRKAMFGEKDYGSWMPYTNNNGTFDLNDLAMPQFIDYYKSFLSGFIAYGNEALKAFDDWKASRLMTGYPQVVEKEMPCNAQGCDNGYVWDAEGENRRKCNSCNGTGSVNVRSPYGKYIVKVPDSTTLENQTLVDDPISFVQPPVEGLRYMGETWEMLIKKAEQSIYQLFNDSVQSGDAKEVDREGKYTLIKMISDHMFKHIIWNHLWILIRLRNIVNPEMPIVVAPQSFMIRNEASLIDELKALNEANAPIQVKIRAQRELVKKRYSGEAEAERMLDAVILFDSLYGQSMADIQTASMLGAVNEVDIQRHLMADSIVYKLISRNGAEWLTKNDDALLADMNAEFALVAKPTRTEIIIPE